MMKALLFCLFVVLSPYALGQDSQPTTAPTSIPTSSPGRWEELPQLTAPALLLSESTSAPTSEPSDASSDDLRDKLLHASKITGIMGISPLALSWLIAATMNPQSTDSFDPEAPPTPSGAIAAGAFFGGTGKTLISASLTTFAFARYQHTKKIRTLYAATGVAALHSIYLSFLTLGFSFANFDSEIENHVATMLAFSNATGMFSSFAVDVIFLVGTVQQSVKRHRASR